MRFLLPLVMCFAAATATASERSVLEEPTQVIEQPAPEPTHRIQEEPGVQVHVAGVRVIVGYRPVYGVVAVRPAPVAVTYVPVAYPSGCWLQDRWIRRQMVKQVRRHGAIAVMPAY